MPDWLYDLRASVVVRTRLRDRTRSAVDRLALGPSR